MPEGSVPTISCWRHNLECQEGLYGVMQLKKGVFPSRELQSLVVLKQSIVGCFKEVPYAQNIALEV